MIKAWEVVSHLELENEAVIMKQRYLLIYGIVLIILAFAGSGLQRWLLPAASDLSAAVFLGLCSMVNLSVGILCLIASFIRGRKLASRIIQTIFCVIAILVLGWNAWTWGGMAWNGYIAPQAEIIIPDDYVGTVRIQVRHAVFPSRQIAGKIYQYAIPATGTLEEELGWLGDPLFSCSYDMGESRSSGYGLFIRHANGTPLHAGEFSVDYDYPAQEKLGKGSRALVLQIKKQ